MKRVIDKKAFSLIARLAAIAFLAMLIAMPVSARAAGHDPFLIFDPVSDTVEFTGHATATPPVQQVGGNGTFGLTSNLCQASSDPGVTEGMDDLTPTSCTISASGNYSNTVCGEGFVTGTADIYVPEEQPNGPYAHVTFTAEFIDGTGPITGQGQEFDPGENDNGNEYPITIAGVINLTPDLPLLSAPNCAAGFTVSAVPVTIEEDPVTAP